MPSTNGKALYASSFVFLLCILVPAFAIDRTETPFLLASYFVAFVCYLILWNSENTRFLFVLGITARFVLLFSLPTLSDDLYRFLWDGFLLKNGCSPYAELPGFYTDLNLQGISSELYSQLNSPDYHTVYTPLNQGIFWIAVTISSDWLVAAGVIRVVLFAADLGAVYFLKKFLRESGRNENLAFLYFLNPLVILEGVGNLHVESLVAFFLIATIYYAQKSSLKSGMAIGLAVGTKLLPAIFLPFLFLKELIQRRWKLILATVLVVLATIAPILLTESVQGIKSSLRLYFQNFEFNGSLFAIATWVSTTLTEHTNVETIGPIFSMVTIIGILWISIQAIRRDWEVSQSLLYILGLYLVLASTVHPWYIIPLFILGIASGHVFPLLWTALIFLTYAGYSKDGYQISGVLIVFEYAVVFLAFIYNSRLKKWLTIS